MDRLRVVADLRRFYSEAYDEDVRLTRSPHGRLEFARTRELLERFLPAPPARVLDVGGGTGIHARWLAQAGYAVSVVDLIDEHVAMAGAIPGVTAVVGDARALDFADGAFDAVLVLGPLYHLVERAERLRALAEAARVARSGAVIAAAAISRYAGLLDFGAHGGLTAATVPLVEGVISSGRHDPRLGFTTAYVHRPEELFDELVDAGLAGVSVYGVEGPAGPALDAHGIERIDEFLPSAIACARIAERDPALIAASAHFLALGHANRGAVEAGGGDLLRADRPHVAADGEPPGHRPVDR